MSSGVSRVYSKNKTDHHHIDNIVHSDYKTLITRFYDARNITCPTLILKLYVLQELFPFKAGKYVFNHDNDINFPLSLNIFNVAENCEFFISYEFILLLDQVQLFTRRGEITRIILESN